MDQLEYDQKRTEELSKYGLTVIRFSNTDVMKNTEGILENLLEVIKNIETNPPSPLIMGVETPENTLHTPRIRGVETTETNTLLSSANSTESLSFKNQNHKNQPPLPLLSGGSIP